MIGQRLGSAEALLELQPGFAPEDKKGLGLSELTDDLVVVTVKRHAVAFLITT
jgi:hypothetical protein